MKPRKRKWLRNIKEKESCYGIKNTALDLINTYCACNKPPCVLRVIKHEMNNPCPHDWETNKTCTRLEQCVNEASSKVIENAEDCHSAWILLPSQSFIRHRP